MSAPSNALPIVLLLFLALFHTSNASPVDTAPTPEPTREFSAPPVLIGTVPSGYKCGSVSQTVCGDGSCCSAAGYCGFGKSYCGVGCQNGFGVCAKLVDNGGQCGPVVGGWICKNGCCSSKGWCGTTDAFCTTGCQSAFGTCSASGTPTTTKKTTTTTKSSLPTSVGGGGDDTTRADCLAAHNEVRAAVPITIPDMTYSLTLETAACVWSKNLAENKLFQHSNGQVGSYGENLHKISYSSALPAKVGPALGSCRSAAKSWAAEKAYYSAGYRIAVDGTFSQYGHFTQMVWPTTTEVGCCGWQSLDLKDIVWTCEYSPPGNYVGAVAY